MTVWDDLTRLIADLLQRWGLSAQVLRYSSDFPRLWQQVVEDDVPGSPCLLVYDGIPRAYASPTSLHPIHFDSLFSPVVWYGLVAAGPSEDENARTVPPCVIVDPQGRTDSDHHEQALKQLLAPHLYCLEEYTDLRILGDRLSQNRQIEPWRRKAVRRYLRTLLTEPVHRHAISNIIGPLLLGVEVNQLGLPEVDKQVLLYLQGVLQKIGLLIGRPEISWPWIGGDKLNAIPGVKFVLMDDMADLGWEPLLRQALGLEGRDPRVVTFTSPDKILGKLKDPSGSLRINGGLHLTDRQTEILFLDLRLFARKRTTDEVAFFEALWQLANQTVDRSDLPWEGGGFTTAELKLVRRCIDQAVTEADEYYLALTLFPRLIALVDPRLPIVMFASTGQRRIIQALKPYENIITDFEKPRLFVETTPELFAHAALRFEKAVVRALQLVKGRGALQRFCSGNHSVGQLQAGEAGTNESEPYVEVYLDETGSVSEGAFGVGGLALVCPDEAAAARFNSAMVEKELVWGPSELLTNPDPKDCLWKRIDFNQLGKWVMDPVLEILNKEQAAILGVLLRRASTVMSDDPWNLASPWCLDNVYRNLVLKTLEVLLLEVLPRCLAGKPFRCGVYVATRIRKKLEADDSTWWSELPRRYGVEIRISRQPEEFQYFRSVQSDSAHPMVAEVLTLDPRASVKICAARGARLMYYAERWEPIPTAERLARPAHYLADIFASAGQRARSTRSEPLWTWFERGFWDICDERFEYLLEACRHARVSRHVEALVAAAKASKVLPWARPRIAKSARALSGRDFIEFCARLANNASLPNEGAERTNPEAEMRA